MNFPVRGRTGTGTLNELIGLDGRGRPRAIVPLSFFEGSATRIEWIRDQSVAPLPGPGLEVEKARVFQALESSTKVYRASFFWPEAEVEQLADRPCRCRFP